MTSDGTGAFDEAAAPGRQAPESSAGTGRARSRLETMSPAKRALLAKRLAARRGEDEDALKPVSRDGQLPLSYAQRRLWFMDQVNPGGAMFNVSVALRFEGALRPDVLERAIRDVFRRHESLRTFFPSVGESPVQRILPDLDVDLTPVALPAPAEMSDEDVLREALVAEASRPFSLEDGPLARATLFRRGAEDHVLLLVVHHSVCDGWSMSIVIDELFELYAAAAKGDDALLKPLPLQYADYAAWEARPERTARLDEGLAFWRKSLEGAVPVIELPADRPRPAVQSFRGARHRFALPAGIWQRVEEIATQERATPFMVLLAGFAALLSRYTSHSEVTAVTPVANRPRAEWESLVGFFANSLALRVDTSGDPDFRELVGRVRDLTQEALAHGDVPFDRVVEAVDPDRDLSHTPIAQVLFALVHDPALDITLDGMKVSVVEQHTATAKYDLSLEVWPDADGVLHGVFEYATDLFDAATVERIGTHLGILLDALTEDPAARIADAPLLTEEELRELVVDGNRTADPSIGNRPAHLLFEDRAGRTPDAVALVAGERRLTFGELNTLADRLAHHLRSEGVGPEERVALYLGRGVDLVVAVLATLKAGGTYVPLDTADPAERIAYMLADAAARVVVTDARLAAELPASGARVLVAQEALGSPVPADAPSHPVPHLDNAAYVIYTSGSTGRPKGVVVTHRGLGNYLEWSVRAYRVADGGGAPLVSPLRFDLSVTTLFCPLLAGRPVVLVEEGQELDRLSRMLGRDVEHGLIKLTPAHLDALDKSVPPVEIQADGYLVVGGESLHGRTVEAWRKRAPGLRVVNEYGPTETVVGCCVYEVDDRTDLSGTVPIGRPIANTGLYVLDTNMKPVARGAVGELFIGGAGVARGYWNRPGLTAERFVPDPFAAEPGARLYRTGDLVRMRPDGELECLGRADTQVKVRGYRVELEEIEAALTRLAAVREAVVLLREDRPGEHRLAAYVTPAGDGSGCAEDGLRAELRSGLPEYMVPDHFVVLDELPLAQSGKVDRRALPQPTRDAPVVLPDLPATPLEQVIADVWADVLGLSSVGRKDNFQTLGGHSLLTVQAAARIRKALDMDLPLSLFLEAQSLADLAVRIEALGGRAPRPRLLSAPRTGPVPLSYAQGRLYFMSRLAEGSSFYNVPIALRFDGAFRPDAFRAAYVALWGRHEGLRVRFPSPDGDPVQEFLTAEEFAFEERDLTGTANAEARLAALVQEEAGRPFDLARGPLLRGGLLRLAPDAHVALLTLHHAVSDGWSVSILLDELMALYRAFAAGQPSPLPPLSYTYVDYTLWQRSWLDEETLDAQLGYWKQQLGGAPMLDLPTDRPRPAVQSYRGARHEVAWSRELLDAVAELSRREGVSLFMTLLAGFDVLMARMSGREDVTVGTPIANRTMTELESIVGFFANTLALRVDLAGNPAFTEVLARVKETANGAYAHQDVPFDMVVDAVAPQRSLSHSPLFQVRFALQNMPGDMPGAGEGLTLTEIESEQVTARFDLVVDLWETEDGLQGHAEYNTDLFDADTIARLMGRFETLLGRLAADPGQRILDTDVLLPGEHAELDALAGRAAVTDPDDRTFLERFREQVARRPEEPAVTCGTSTLSYGELGRRSEHLARVLRAHGVGPETTVAVYLERGMDLVVAVLAVLEAGGAYLPLDTAYPPDRVAEIVADARPGLVLTSHALATRTPTVPGGLLLLEDIGNAAVGELPPAHTLSPERPAYIVYTSGTQGKPKGAVLTHTGLDAYVRSLPRALELPERPVVLHTASFAFSSSVRQLMVPLAHGGLVVVATREQLASPDDLLAHAARNGVQVLDLVPSYLRVVAPALARQDWRPEVVLTASEPLLYDLPETIRAQTGGTSRLVNMYGQTETTGIVVTAPVGPDRVGRGVVVPLGRPIDGARVHVVDEGLRRVPPGNPGEIVVSGPGLARGYLGDPALTAERFVPDPCGPAGGRLYRTGDRGRFLPDGALEFLGRVGDQAKIRGHRVEPGEVASEVAELDDVRECAVFCVEDGPDERRLVGYVTLRPGSGITAAELRAGLAEKLPDYMIPTIVTVGSLPRLSNGKVDRVTLLATEATPVQNLFIRTAGASRPATDDSDYLDRVVELVSIWKEVLRLPKVGTNDDFFEVGGDSLHAIRVVDRARKAGIGITPAQFIANPTIAGLAAVATDPGAPGFRHRETLAEIWKEVLRLPEIGHDDDFFEVGGDSLHAIRVVDRARKAGIGITPAQFIANPTIAGLAAVATDPGAPGTGPAETGTVPLVPSNLAFQERDFADKHLYTHIFMFETLETLDPRLMERAVAAVVSHHDSLRISFPKDGGAYRVKVHERFEQQLFTFADLSALDSAAQDLAFRRLDAKLHRKVDFENGPLLHFALVRFGAGRPDRFVAIVHHQLMDNSSWGVLTEDLQAAYLAVAEGEEPRLSPATASFAQWARNLDALARSAELDEDAAYWSALAERAVPDWPLDHQDGVDSMASEESVFVELSGTDTASLRRLIRRDYGLTLNDLLLAAVLGGFAEWTGQKSVLVDLVSRGRELGGEDLDLSRAIGRFSMTSPRLLDLPATPGTRDLLDSVAAQLRAVPRSGLGFGLLRHIGARPDVAQALAPLGKPDILVNNWGEMAKFTDESPLFGAPVEDTWPAPELQRMHRLIVDGRVYDGALRLGFRFSRNLNDRDSIAKLAALVEGVLREMANGAES
ncbi:non-ribosomal peptide synthetase [Streptomyces sp. NBC_01423]|uniref:non-ribosomal peptide synthetase n=1 Tax=Streptomyces sp. NBC_01423 TaxID=2903860 RepID=UPI002E2C66EA|nr:non-ribosomal peptide synthetase [Streptomyces sp. NBC_01423]